MAADDLTKALLLEEICPPRAIAEALFVSVTGDVPLLQALVDSGAANVDVLARYLARSEAPFVRQVVPAPELVGRLPPGLCARLFAVPIRRDPTSNVVEVAVANPSDPHPGEEIAYHLGAPVRLVRATIASLEEAIRRLRMSSQGELGSAAARFHEAARAATTADAREPRPGTLPPPPSPFGVAEGTATRDAWLDAIAEPRQAPPRRGGLVIEEEDSVPPPQPSAGRRIRTPPWGTPIHLIARQETSLDTEPPKSEYGSEIPIPLTRKTAYPRMSRGGTERPPAMIDPANAGLGEGYAFDTSGFRDVVERTAPRQESVAPRRSIQPGPAPGRDVANAPIPGPPRLPGAHASRAPRDEKAKLQAATREDPEEDERAGQVPRSIFPELGGVVTALRSAATRDEILELLLAGGRMLATKVAIFVVKKGGYAGWVGSPEFGDRTALQALLIPIDASSVFDRAVREDLYLGPIRYDEVHAPLLRAMRNPSRDIAVVPIRVSGKTAAILVADDLGDTMIGTRRLEELARAGGEAFARIVRTRR